MSTEVQEEPVHLVMSFNANSCSLLALFCFYALLSNVNLKNYYTLNHVLYIMNIILYFILSIYSSIIKFMTNNSFNLGTLCPVQLFSAVKLQHKMTRQA